MSRYIDKDALIAEFKRLTLGENSLIERVFADSVYAVIETFPAADVDEVRHGEWVWQFTLDDDDFFECSICGRQEVINGLCNERNPVEHLPYCHCGAKMDGERREGKDEK